MKRRDFKPNTASIFGMLRTPCGLGLLKAEK